MKNRQITMLPNCNSVLHNFIAEAADPFRPVTKSSRPEIFRTARFGTGSRPVPTLSRPDPGASHKSRTTGAKLCPPLPQTSMYFLRTYSMLTLVRCCIHLCARFKRVTCDVYTFMREIQKSSSLDTFYRF